MYQLGTTKIQPSNTLKIGVYSFNWSFLLIEGGVGLNGIMVKMQSFLFRFLIV